jgi:uncharacterized membrane protein YccC
MNQQFPAGWIIAILTLITYFSIGILLTGEVALFIGVLLLVLVIWFLFCKIRYKDLGNLELLMRMYADFTGTVERIKERVAEDEAGRKAAADRRRRGLTDRERNRERRKTESSNEVPVDKKYTDLIERRVREAKAKQEQSEGPNETES